MVNIDSRYEKGSQHILAGIATEVVYSPSEYSTAMGLLAQDIKNFYSQLEPQGFPHSPIRMIAMGIGGIFPAVDIQRKLVSLNFFEVEVDIMNVSSYDEHNSSGVVVFDSKPKYSVNGAHVLLVDDMGDTLLSMEKTIEKILEDNPASVHFVVPTYKVGKQRREFPYNDLQIGAEHSLPVPHEDWGAGGGLDEGRKLRGLPFIVRVLPDNK